MMQLVDVLLLLVAVVLVHGACTVDLWRSHAGPGLSR